jgi:tetratricopeptide (TPR) repeat protein
VALYDFVIHVFKLRAISKDDMTPEQKLNEAHELIQSGLYADSIKILNELATSSQDFNISYLLGVAYQRTDNFILAEKNYKDSIRLKSDHFDAYLGLGITYQKQGKFNDAINSIENALRINRFFDDAYNSLGFTYKLKGDFNKAIATYQLGLEILFDNIYNFINKNKEFIDDSTVANKFNTSLWFETASKVISQNASSDGMEKLRFPTPETVENLRTNNLYGNELYIDDGHTRSILPNMLNNYADKLSWNIRYANFLNNIGVIYLEMDEKKKAKQYFIEAILFTPENVNFQNPIINLEYTED